MCLFVQQKRREIAFSQTRAIAQASLGGEAAEKTFEEFAEAYNQVDRQANRKDLAQQLERLKQIKEIRFQPLAPLTSRTSVPRVTLPKDYHR